MSTQKFKKIFEGLDRAYGQYSPGDIKNGKVGGNAVTKRGFISDTLWEDHLAGKAPSLGSIPIRDDSTCSWGCIDIDTYPLDYKKVISNIRKNKLPFVPCRSKSGGAHLFLFTEEPITAEIMRNKLMELAGGLGYGSCEIFPKQVELNTTRGDIGSFLNLPYFDSSNTMRYAFLDDGSAATLDQFFDLYDEHKIKKEDFEKIKIKTKKKTSGFDSIKKYQTENSIWYITIDGRQVRVRTKTLHKQDTFQETVYDQINVILPDLSRKDWKIKLQEIGNNAEIIEMGDDVSPEGRFDQHLHAYVNDQGKGLTIDEVNYGKAFEENDKIYFKMEFLLMYLEKQRFRGFDAVRVAARLKERDAKSVVRKVEKKNTRLWEIDNESFKRIESLPLPKEEDLNKEEDLPF